MKKSLFLLALLFIGVAQAQVSNEKLKMYAGQLGVKNAQLLKCDSISSTLEVIYFNFMKSALSNRLPVSRSGKLLYLEMIHYSYHKQILTVLKGKPRRIYLQLWRKSGNILLHIPRR